jgi:hypothetical protein
MKKLHTKRQKKPGKSTEDFWMSEPGTGQQVAQLHDSYIMMVVVVVIMSVCLSVLMKQRVYCAVRTE